MFAKKTKSLEKAARQRPLFRFKLPSEEAFRTAIAVSAIALASVFVAGNYGIARENGIKSKECTASIGQIADYAGRHPLKTTIFLLADVAAIAAFSIVYFGAISRQSKLGLND
jgi:hypothetical protein